MRFSVEPVGFEGGKQKQVLPGIRCELEEGVPMLDRIEYFLTLAEEKNITHAAKRLYVSQQCLSAYLKELEEEYGVQLFYRKPQFMLTPAGETFYRAA